MPKLHIILDILHERNISIQEFCKEINLSVSGFKRIIDRNSTRLQTLELIAQTLNCPMSVFFNEPQLKQKVKKQTLIPHIPLTAQAGALTGFSEGVSEYNCEMNCKIESLGSYDFTIDVRGDSMLPDYQSGDVVACKTLQPGDSIHSGAIYILDTAQGVIMKKVEKIPGEKDFIFCISLNEAYAPFKIPLEDILGMSRVIGVIKSL